MSEIKYVGQMSSSQNSRVIDPSGISYAVTNGHKDGEPKIIEVRAIGRERTEEEKRRRHLHGDKEAKFSGGKQMCFLSEVSGCLTTSPTKDNLVGEIYDVNCNKQNRMNNDTLTSVRKDNLVAEPLCIPQATKQGYIEVPPGSVFDASYPDSKTRRGRVQEGGQVSSTLMAGGEAPCYYEGKTTKPDECRLVGGSWDGWQDDRVFDIEGSSPTLDTNSEKRPRIQGDATSYRIRKLTPRECFRLMGVSETNIDKIQQSGVSQSQQYKMAGNSIVVDCLYHLFRKMLTETQCESQQLSLF